MNRVQDNEGDLWPITGCLCLRCKWPLIPVAGSTDHPLCDTDEQDEE